MRDSNSALAKLKAMLAAGAINREDFELVAAAIADTTAVMPSLQAEQAAVIVDGPNNGPINTGTQLQIIYEAGTRVGADTECLRQAYLARLMQECDQLPLLANDEGARLSAVYTTLLVAGTEQHSSQPGRPSDTSIGKGDGRAPAQTALDRANVARKLVLLGGPGSGKTSFVHILGLAMASELLHAAVYPLARLTVAVRRSEEEQQPQPQRWDHPVLLPVRVVLRELAAELPASEGEINAETLFGYIVRRLQAAGLGEYAPHLKRELLEQGGLILLDGLDEVPDALERRSRIKKAVETFTRTFQRCRYLATSRTYAYRQQDWKLSGFVEAQLLPFTPWQVQDFIDAWYAHMVALCRLSPAEADRRAQRLKQAAAHNPRIAELAERPLLLTLIAKLQTEKTGSLPEKPEELYDQAVEMLLEEWERTKPRRGQGETDEPEPSLAEYLRTDRERIRKMLDKLAFEAHRDQAEPDGTANIPRQRLLAALVDSTDADVKPERLVEYLRDRAGLLSEHGVGVYQFPHRSFQEYLAACHLTGGDFPDTLAALACRDPNRWREVVALAAAKSRRGNAASVWLLADTLCPDPVDSSTAALHQALPTEAAWGALLAGHVLTEHAELGAMAPRDHGKRRRIQAWQQALLRRPALPAAERALAGRSLAVLGDPRPEVTTLDSMQFCYVPAGPFRMGGQQFNNEKPCHTVTLDPYWIARYPVTVAQWRDYVQAGGGRPGETESLEGPLNTPVVRISWHEALNFCAWSQTRWAGRLPPGWRVRLPSEAQWEKAARGGLHVPAVACLAGIDALRMDMSGGMEDNPHPEREYPWGQAWDPDHANVEFSIGGPSAVGAFPKGGSPYGVEDLSGNVWEWTRSVYAPYPYSDSDASPDDSNTIVVRGGAWDLRRDDARCAVRGGPRPGDRYSNLGFRVVLCVSPVRSSVD
ncbi:MAG: NACHT domain-containing protein [Lysobacteraceae bacterium]|nr:MAG: NACHT domain-containing protein [Xanthomonadaceae bacterium]